jgi:acyl carrier protein
MTVQELLGPLFPEVARPLTAADSPETIAAWDSVRQVDVILAVEEEFGIALGTAEIAELRSVAALVALLARRGLLLSL